MRHPHGFKFKQGPSYPSALQFSLKATGVNQLLEYSKGIFVYMCLYRYVFKVSVLLNCWLYLIRKEREDEASSPRTNILLSFLTRPGPGGGEENAFFGFYLECCVFNKT